jgi:hypothetical protein
LVLNIWYQSSRSWGFDATSETPWNFRYNFFSTTFQKERLGGYLGFDDLMDMYRDDPDFKEAYEAAENPILRDRSQWTKYMI